MGKIGFGYGSEWHMLRWLGRHRQALNHQIQRTVKQNLGRIEWLDFQRSQSSSPLKRDKEIIGLDFISSTANPTLHSAWKQFWPSSGNSQNWDAVGKFILPTGQSGWLLVEAKAHIGELTSNCGAASKQSLSQIKRSLDITKQAMGVPPKAEWLKKHYQYANRLAALHFLKSHQVDAHLVFVYFCGDENPRQNCPIAPSGWNNALNKLHQHLQLPSHHLYSNQIHSVFLNV
ncbi:MAG: hypothetical protein VX026_03955 [Myxococcota bacterium]|nr:hypothetical protein [Myxococcota bacterium]